MKAVIWAGIFATVLLWSGIDPKDGPTWFLEVLPALIGALALFVTRVRFPLTPMLYILILAHCIILMVGGHYTYAQVPLFDELKEILGWQRNNYDKLGHFAQGLVPALIAREIVLRRGIIVSAGWRNFFILCFCLALSAFYELIEWWVALATDAGAEAFLGTQGYIWDTQSDMAMALLGALFAILVLAKTQDRQLRTAGFI